MDEEGSFLEDYSENAIQRGMVFCQQRRKEATTQWKILITFNQEGKEKIRRSMLTLRILSILGG